MDQLPDSFSAALQTYKNEIAEKEAITKLARKKVAQERERKAAEEKVRQQALAAEEYAQREVLAKTAALTITHSLLNGRGKMPVGVTIDGRRDSTLAQEWKLKTSEARRRRAERLDMVGWRLRNIGNVAVLRISRMFSYETGGWDRLVEVPSAELWLYDNELPRPSFTRSTRHSEPERLLDSRHFERGSWQELAATLGNMQLALDSKTQTTDCSNSETKLG